MASTQLINVPIYVTIKQQQVSDNTVFPITVEISPSSTKEQTLSISYPFSITAQPILVNVSDVIIDLSYNFLSTALDNYVDEERELKTLLNYGEDKQSLVLAYRTGSSDQALIPSIQLKLLQPVPDDISTDTPVFLTREVAKSSIDRVRIRFAPEIDNTPYLRPKNVSVKSEMDLGKRLNNVTLKLLSLSSGSVGADDQYSNKTFEDEIFRKWYSYDFNSSELNLDFTNYENFVFYGSAAMRLAAFREKLKLLERIESNRIQFISSSAYSAITSSAGAMYVQQKTADYALEKENIIRAFDRYDQYLYFTPSGSTSAYSASAFYADGGTEYHFPGYWPKTSSGSVYSIYSSEAIEWFESQSLIAQRFDEFNENNITNTIPTHIREYDENDAYITFVSMIGHFFDTIKPYIDQYKYIYNRDLDPNIGLSKDLVNEIAESIGFRLPTLNSTFGLTNNILGSENTEPRRDLTAEIYKRLLHNIPFFAKAKGTKTALESLVKTFGITPELLSVKETGTPVSSSYTVFEEYTNGIDFDDTVVSYITLPIQASNRNPTTIQLNATFAKTKKMTLLTGDNKWALDVVPHPTNNLLGRVEIVSGSSRVLILSSSYEQIFGDELVHITLQNAPTEAILYVTQVEGADILHRSITSISSASFGPLWNTTQFIYAGGAGSLVFDRFDGTIDELRVWNDGLSEEVILNAAFDPGTNAGDTYQGAANNLLVELSFDLIDYALLSASSSLLNESPYMNKSTVPQLNTIPVVNINSTDFSRYVRSIKQDMILAGSSGTTTEKIRVAGEPIFLDANSEVKTLYRNKSIVSPQQKRLQKGRNKVIVSMSPTNITNQQIIRNIGFENINSVLGAPTTLYTQYEKSLQTLKTYYERYYYVDVNINRFIRILSEVNSILNQVVEYFIPSKATVLNGIVIEPNILDQVKISPIKNIRFYGKNARKTLAAPGSLTGSKPDYSATFNVSDTIKAFENTNVDSTYNVVKTQLNSTAVTAVTGSFMSLKGIVAQSASLEGKALAVKGTLELDELALVGVYNTVKGTLDIGVAEASGSYDTKYANLGKVEPALSGSTLPLKGNIDQIQPSAIEGKYATYLLSDSDTDIVRKVSFIDAGLTNLNKIPYNDVNRGAAGAEPYNRVYPRKLLDNEIFAIRFGGLKSIYTPALYEIKPSADFTDFGVITYFNNTQGIYYFEQQLKNPTYANPINSTWDFSNQSFSSVATWSYGSRFNQYDVVYQNIDTSYATDIGEDVVKSSLSGNKKYYVFKTKPSYLPPSDGTSFYSGSVPSYTPPSLDNKNWEILRFTPTIKRIPKRVVFDTFTISDPALSNYKTTTISIDKILDVPNRYVDQFIIPEISANTSVTGEILLQNVSALFAIQATDANIRIRLYRTSVARDADITRGLEVSPSGSHGVLLDAVYTSANTADILSPFVTLVNDADPEDGKIYYTITNLTSIGKFSFTLFLYYFAIQIEPRVPIGYLRKHYKFFRENTTALKRRNYIGCKNTEETTIDGLPPIQVFLSEGTEITVSPSITNNEIITGGGGTLNVT